VPITDIHGNSFDRRPEPPTITDTSADPGGLARHFTDLVDRIADELIDVAGWIRQRGHSTAPGGQLDIALAIVHRLNTTTPNLPLELLVRGAVDIDKHANGS
jgi:hypothetical protein